MLYVFFKEPPLKKKVIIYSILIEKSFFFWSAFLCVTANVCKEEEKKGRKENR